uniref:Disease resistance R13L4/SHOC-2-like LRR domain-containing protein n=1 Tax=Trichuris muris TaxID=70415 RepID=A0A5S6QLQ9_TRIMR
MFSSVTFIGSSVVVVLLAGYWAQKYLPPPKPRIVGIDLGTTFSCVSVYYAGSGRVEVIPDEKGRKTVPSIVAVKSKSVRLVGYDALEYGDHDPSRVLYDAKRFIGLHFNEETFNKEKRRYPFRMWLNETTPVFQVKIGNGTKGANEELNFRPEEISATLLTRLRKMAQSHLQIRAIEKAVISVPAEFDEARRNATVRAAALAGLEVMRLISEPTAAALAYGLHQKANVSSVVIYDLGGGTLDVSVLMIMGGMFLTRAIAGKSSFLKTSGSVKKLASKKLFCAGRSAAQLSLLETFVIFKQTYSTRVTCQSLYCNFTTLLVASIYSAIACSLRVSSMVRKSAEGEDPGATELDLGRRGIVSFAEITHIFANPSLTRLTLSHNKITVVPPSIVELATLEVLNLWNNRIEELPTSISLMTRLRVLNLGMNHLRTLPRGFGSFPALEVLDLTHNQLNERSLPGNFFMIETLRALYLSENDFEVLPSDIRNLKNLQVLALRDNSLIYLPKELGELSRLRELHVQGNRLSVLPPEIAHLDLVGPKQVLRLDHNPWVTPISEQLQKGETHLISYLRSETYKYLYGRHLAAGASPPPKLNHRNNHLGGQDFNQNLLRHLLNIVRERHGGQPLDKGDMHALSMAVEQAKIELTSQPETVVQVQLLSFKPEVQFRYTVTRPMFEQLNAGLFRRAIKPIQVALADADVTVEDVDEIVMVGGSTRIPRIRQVVSQYFNNKTLNCEIDPELAVAIGVGIQAGVMAQAWPIQVSATEIGTKFKKIHVYDDDEDDNEGNYSNDQFAR